MHVCVNASMFSCNMFSLEMLLCLLVWWWFMALLLVHIFPHPHTALVSLSLCFSLFSLQFAYWFHLVWFSLFALLKNTFTKTNQLKSCRMRRQVKREKKLDYKKGKSVSARAPPPAAIEMVMVAGRERE